MPGCGNGAVTSESVPLQIRILGEPAALDASGRSLVRGRGQIALLALLTLHRNHVVARARLADLLTPEEDDPASKALPMAVSRLRRALGSEGDRLETVARGYRLRLDPGEVDADRFLASLAEGRRLLAGGEPESAAALLRAATDEWSGPALGSLASEVWAVGEALRLEEARLGALELRLEADLAHQPAEAVAAEIAGLAAEHPERESLIRLQMLALYRSGRQAEALAVYRSARVRLAEDAALDPSPALQELEMGILIQDPSLAPPRQIPGNLPVDLDLLIGRRAEIDEVNDLIGKHRLVTLHGTGGTGKTRLAIEVGRTRPFGRGTRLVELAAITEAVHVLPAIATAMGLPPGDPDAIPASIASRIGSSPALLLLDNFEQVIEAGVGVAELLRAVPLLHVLVTSRAPLQVRGEQVYEVEPLPVPDEGATSAQVAETDAARLFLDRATAGDRGWQPGPSEVESVGRLCRLLDGLPLAIELAAGLVRTGALPSLMAGMERLLPLLSAGPRDLPPRQRSLRATIAWSRDLLSPAARDVFDQLGSFVGGWSMDAAAAVAELTVAETAAAMTELLSRSLIYRSTGPDLRYGMLEMIREFATEQLAERRDGDEVRRRHARFVATWMIDGGMRDGDAGRRRQLLAEQPNLRRALEWGIEHDPAMALKLASASTDFWDDAGLWRDGIGYLKGALEQNPQDSVARAHALAEAGVLSAGLGDYDVALAFMEESRELYLRLGEEKRAAAVLIPITGALTLRSDFERAGATGRAAVLAMSQADDLDSETLARLHVADLSWLGGNPQAALPLARQALADAFGIGQSMYQIMARYVISGALLGSGDIESARTESLLVIEATAGPGYAKYRCLQAAIQARIELQLGNITAADDWSRDAVRSSAAINDRWTGAIALEVLAEVALAIGDHHRSGVALGAARALRERLGAPTPPAFLPSVRAAMAGLEEALSGDDLAQCLAEGHRMSLDIAARGLGSEH
jgi:predicted ATPase/DNA-binding SARP family transcriptional activator